MKRSLDQNALLHSVFREISIHLIASGVTRCSHEMCKELCKMLLGNTTEFMSTKIAMPTSSYKQKHSDLTESELKHGVIAMDEFILKIVAWAATDIELELKSPNE